MVPTSISGNVPKTPPVVSEAVSRSATPLGPNGTVDYDQFYDAFAGSSLESGSLDDDDGADGLGAMTTVDGGTQPLNDDFDASGVLLVD